ncbi:MAG: thioredoxin family protein [Saprospiraceae bacterium]|nr:thioredoxin family protein [Saprospiraceae bacterium]
MALKESNMLPLGTKAPDFVLPDVVQNKMVQLYDQKEYPGTLIMFICNHCPYVIHVLPELRRLTKEYSEKGIRIIAISSNDVVHYPDDAPDKMRLFALKNEFVFPYCYDETQEVAKSYDAACTPDFYLFDPSLHLRYRGRLDASRPGNSEPLNGRDLRNALDDVLSGKAISELQYPSAGCNIKWRKDSLV